MNSINKNRLEELKDERFLKSSEVARNLGINRVTYFQWENNKTNIPTRRIIQIAQFYNVNVDYIFYLSNKKTSINNNYQLNLNLIGNRLKEIRNDLGLTLREIANKLGTSFSAFSSYERGERLIQSYVLVGVCKLSNTSIDWLLGISNTKYLQ